MNYCQALDFLYSQLPAYHQIGKAAYRNDLKNTILLDEYFKHPHSKFRSVHIAGTNGKGSISNLTASILQEAGYKTGLYTSPHLLDFRERIRIDGKMIPEKEVVDFVEKNIEIISEIRPSFFEMTVAMAFNYFEKENVDIAIIEAGLGGRLDSTNIITPVLSVITNIGHDHMDLLGDTIGKVAIEKAGIIKPGIPVVIGESLTETRNIFKEKASDRGAEIIFAEKEFFCRLNDYDPGKDGREYTISNKDRQIITGISSLTGDYQEKNLVTTTAIINNLRNNYKINDKHFIDGIRKVVENTNFAGRWQKLSEEPLIICDTGHNREGLESVVDQLGRIQRKKLHIILGFVNDKDVDSVLALFPRDATYYFAKASVARAMNEKILREKAIQHSLKGEDYESVHDAICQVLKNSTYEDLIFIGGSTFIVADAINYFKGPHQAALNNNL